MKNREEIKDELKELSPFLWEQKGRPEGFGVPRDYFKSLPEEVFKKLGPERRTVAVPKENWWENLMKYVQSLFQPKYALAFASIALLLVAGIFYMKKDSASTATPPLAGAILDQVPDDVLQDYISNNIDEFDESILEEELTENTSGPLPEFNLNDPDELMDEILDDLDINDLKDLL